MTRDPRIIAVDWSGDASSSAKKIWLAEIADGQVIRLEAGRDREAMARHLVELSERDQQVVIGLDFGFSFPRWYLAQLAVVDAPSLWHLVAEQGEDWLRECAPPFWGRPGKTRPELQAHLRRTELEVGRVNGISPKSTFQIGGGGAVGTGSIRGMPLLARLHDAGYAIWPFVGPRLPLVVEIYPRLLTGPVNKSDPAARRGYLERYRDLPERVRRDAEASEDAFDALVSAIVMWEHREHLLQLHSSWSADDLDARLEGAIWAPPQAREGTTDAPLPASESFDHDAAHRDLRRLDKPQSPDAWRDLVTSMLPAPVTSDGPIIVGGEPGEVAVEIDDDTLSVYEFAVEWRGHLPEPALRLESTFQVTQAIPTHVAKSIVRARASRLRKYRWCISCREMNPPEWMFDTVICQGCAQRKLQVVF